MLTTFSCLNAVHKADLLLILQTLLLRIEVATKDAADFPTGPTVLIAEAGHSVLQEELHVFFEGIDGNGGAIPVDLDGRSHHSGEFIGPRLKHCHHVLGEVSVLRKSPLETRGIGAEADLDIALGSRRLANGGLALDAHIVRPGLCIFLP